MTSNTFTKLSNEDLSCISGGQKIYCAFDPIKNKTCFFVAYQAGFFMCHSKDVAIINSPTPNPAIENCTDIADAERKARKKVEQLNALHRFKQKWPCSLL